MVVWSKKWQTSTTKVKQMSNSRYKCKTISSNDKKWHLNERIRHNEKLYINLTLNWVTCRLLVSSRVNKRFQCVFDLWELRWVCNNFIWYRCALFPRSIFSMKIFWQIIWTVNENNRSHTSTSEDVCCRVCVCVCSRFA